MVRGVNHLLLAGADDSVPLRERIVSKDVTSAVSGWLSRTMKRSEMMPPMRVPDLKAKKQRGEKIAVLTAYDATMARLFDRAGVDALLVGDSLGMVVLGHETTLPVTLDDMIHHTRAVVRGTERALVVADMPFLTYQVSVAEAVRNAGRLLQEGGAAAVKLEGGRRRARRRDAPGRRRHPGDGPSRAAAAVGPPDRRLPQAGARTPRRPTPCVGDATALERAGAFAIVLEAIPAELAATVTARLAIPTIGIGAGPDCDGQVLVSHDMLGLFDGHVPSFVKQYAAPWRDHRRGHARVRRRRPQRQVSAQHRRRRRQSAVE